MKCLKAFIAIASLASLVACGAESGPTAPTVAPNLVTGDYEFVVNGSDGCQFGQLVVIPVRVASQGATWSVTARMPEDGTLVMQLAQGALLGGLYSASGTVRGIGLDTTSDAAAVWSMDFTPAGQAAASVNGNILTYSLPAPAEPWAAAGFASGAIAAKSRLSEATCGRVFWVLRKPAT